MFPTFDFEDQIPTNFPSLFTLNSFPKIVSVAGKNASWKNPNAPNDIAIMIGFRTGTESSNPSSFIIEITGTIVNPIMVGTAVQRQASTGFLALMTEYLTKVPTAKEI
jgi:hypothetical protein